MDPHLTAEKNELVALASLPGVQGRHILEMLTLFGSPAGALDAVRGGFDPRASGRPGRRVDWKAAAGEMDPDVRVAGMEERGIKALVRGEPGYPELLAEAHDPPWVLFCRGRVPLPGTSYVAVVGSRKATPYGLEVAGRLAADLASAGVCVVSGAAYGIDSAAHRGALGAGGCTVAVLGCGPDVVYPRFSGGLYRQIEGRGALMSEYPPGTLPSRHHFPARNRIIAGMAGGVLVVEASRTSGALITVEHALSEGREVFAVPGPIFAGNHAGVNDLIKNGATPVTSVDDILEGLGLQTERSPQRPLFESDHKGGGDRLLSRVRSGIADIEELAEQSGMPVREALSVISRLEVEGLVRRGPGGRYHPTA